MSFADFALFAIASAHIENNNGVTIAFNCEFLNAARAGHLMEARGEVLHAGRSLVFVRGIITAIAPHSPHDKFSVLSFSGTLKKFTSPNTTNTTNKPIQ